jgi:glycosyltransferase involved in cell wall biosynthesis
MGASEPSKQVSDATVTSDDAVIETDVSAIITTYRGDDADELSDALDSILDQTLPPAEVVLVEDGPVTADIESTVADYQHRHSEIFSILPLESNWGQGYARRIGIENANHDLVAMMDADDVSVPQRFELQVEYLQQHPEIDAVGGYSAEFTTDMDSPHAVRQVPVEPAAVASKARFKSPMNQTTVMARRAAILDAGNYRGVDRMEDYGLWGRMLSNGSALANLPTVLAKVRGGGPMYTRRGGWEYAREEVRLQRQFLDMGFVSLPVALVNLCIRVPIRLLPNRLRAVLYSRFLRN